MQLDFSRLVAWRFRTCTWNSLTRRGSFLTLVHLSEIQTLTQSWWIWLGERGSTKSIPAAGTCHSLQIPKLPSTNWPWVAKQRQSNGLLRLKDQSSLWLANYGRINLPPCIVNNCQYSHCQGRGLRIPLPNTLAFSDLLLCKPCADKHIY